MLLVVLFGSVLSVPSATAQSRTEAPRAVVLQDAPIFLTPDASRTPLRVAATGTNLQVLGTENGWLNVRFQDPQYGPRVGYVEAKAVRQDAPTFLRPLDLSIPEPASRAAVSKRIESRSSAAQASDPVAPSTSARVSSPMRQGMWGNIGFGIGSYGCEGCDGDRVNGLSGGFSIGATLSQRLRLGVGSTGWAKRDIFGNMLTVGTIDGRVRFYPSVHSGFFATGGLGLGSIRYRGESENGVGVVLGLGWDIDVAKHASLTPFWNGFAMRSSVADANVGQIGLGITIH
jgi:hypothetical protein